VWHLARVGPVALVIASVTLIGCDPGYHMWVRNESQEPLIVVLDQPEWTAYRVEPGESGSLISTFGDIPRGLRLTVLSRECDVRARFPVESRSFGVIVRADGSITASNVPPDGLLQTAGSLGPSRSLPVTDSCRAETAPN
jgi:hypothetical protein